MKAPRKALTLLSLFVLSYVFTYIFISTTILQVAVLAVNETNETTTTTVNTTSTTSTVPTTTTSTTTTVNTTTTTTTTTTVPNVTTTTTSTTTTTTFPNATTTTSTSTTTVPTTTTTTLPAKLYVSLTLEKDTYYPKDNFNPRAKVTDQNGNVVISAAVTGNLTYATGRRTISFFYSTLCDCYKSWDYFSEGTLPSDYTLTVTATASGYQSGTAEKKFSVLKPALSIEIGTDKTEYYMGEAVKLTIKFKDNAGNPVTPDSISGEMRRVDTGELVTTIYPWRSSEGVYYYTYYFASYVGTAEADKSYKFSVSAKWKEQEASGSVTMSMTRRGLNADISIEKSVLMPGDTLHGKIKVFDKYGNTVQDAVINIWIKDAKGGFIKYLSAKYNEGFYEIDEWLVEEKAYVATGKYTLHAEIKGKEGESITLEKEFEIQKEKLNVKVFFDQSSYSPGSRIYIKVLITYTNGSVVGNAYIGGEMFPLETSSESESEAETSASSAASESAISGGIASILGRISEAIAGAGSAISGSATSVRIEPKICKIYFHPEGPIYFKGSWIQKYYVDDSSIPSWCPTGKYGLKLTVNVPGYAETLVEEEFDVALAKLLMETGFKIDSNPNNVNLYIYAEVKDDTGSVVPYANVMGYLYPLKELEETGGCLKRISLSYDDYIKRYSTTAYLQKYECPAGDYMLEITASQTSYESAKVEQAVFVNYTEGYKYSVVVPPVVGTETPVCKEVSCGSGCTQRICSTPTLVAQCFEEVVDKDCAINCKNKATAVEESASKGTAVAFDLDSCVAACKKNVSCRGSNVTAASNEEMMAKLEEIHKEVGETKGALQTLVDLLTNLVNLLTSLFGSKFAQPAVVTTTVATTTTV